MVFGWFLLGIAVAYGALFIEENESILNLLTYIGVVYIIYLSYQISVAKPINDDDDGSDEKLGMGTGVILQIVN